MIEIVDATPENFRDNQPIARPVGEAGFWIWKRPIWLLMHDYRFTWGKSGRRERIWIKAPRKWDGSSVPAFGALLGHLPAGVCMAASLVHDEFCGNDYKLPAGEYQVEQPDGSWLDVDAKWPGLKVHEFYRWMCVLGGMGEGKAMTRKIAVVFWPPNWK